MTGPLEPKNATFVEKTNNEAKQKILKENSVRNMFGVLNLIGNQVHEIV